MRAYARYVLLLIWVAAGVAGAGEHGSSPKSSQAAQVIDPAHRAGARIAVRNLALRCRTDARLDTDVILSTVGSEYREDGQIHFLPVLALAFDREIHSGKELEWIALWNLGQQATGLGSNLRALLPWGARKHSANWKPPAKKIRLLEQLQNGEADENNLQAPAPDLDAVHLGHASYTGLTTSSMRRILGWGGVSALAQFSYRTGLFRRRDLRDRRFQETYQGLVWYLDAVDSTGLTVPQETMAEIKFHLIRNRSTFAPWVPKNQFLESSWAYDSARRQRTISVSSTLMTAANEYGLGFEEFHQPVVNGTPTPVGGLLYYDPAAAPAPEEARWDSPNLFDLRYNPFTDPRVQGMAKQYPGERIPLALYSYYAVLPRKPIILVDFFDPDNPRKREAAAMRMSLLREFLGASPLKLVMWGIYKPVSYIANKKAFTPLANRVPSMGVEEFRLLLRNRLLFEPSLADSLLRLVDNRELNPLMPAGDTQRLNAQIHYLLLTGKNGAKACETVQDVRRRLYRESTGQKVQVLTSDQLRALEPWLAQRRALRKLSVLAESNQTWEQLREESELPLRTLETTPPVPRLRASKTLLNLERRLLKEQDALAPTVPADLEGMRRRVEQLLAVVRVADGKAANGGEWNLPDLQRKVAEERRRQEVQLAKEQTKEFDKRLQKALHWLTRLQAQPDLRRVSSWRVEQAVQFLAAAPVAATQNPILKPVLARYQERIEQALAKTEALLRERNYEEETVERARLRCMALLAGARLPATISTRLPSQPNPISGGNRREP